MALTVKQETKFDPNGFKIVIFFQKFAKVVQRQRALPPIWQIVALPQTIFCGMLIVLVRLASAK